MTTLPRVVAVLLLSAGLVAVGLGAPEPDSWLTAGRDWRQSYYSPLADIDATNIERLGYAWGYDLDFSSTLEATPLVVDGVMYTSGNRGNVYALAAATGRLLWKFEPVIDAKFDPEAGYGYINRGVAVSQGKVFVGAIDGWLYALSAADGSVVWKVNTITDHGRAYSSTGAPYIAGNRVVIGNAGAEYDARGYFTAYDTETGKQAWRFFTVPGDPKKGFEHPELKLAARTWAANSRWDVGLGGTVWDGMAYDPELNLLYVGTGNGAPWDRNIRSPGGGDNLFLSCILALSPDTGRLVWYYQTVPGDTLDYTATQKMILADLTIDNFEYQQRQLNWGVNQSLVQPDGTLPAGTLPDGVQLDQPVPRPKMFLRAWNPVEQRLAWEVEMTGAVAGSYFLRRPGGVVSTASGLVFQGHIDGHFRVFDARTGAQLRDIYVGTSMMAAPMTYRIAGEQYVSIMAGVGDYPGYADELYGTKGRIVTFKLDGGDVPLRPLLARTAAAAADELPPDTGTEEQISSGRTLFERNCAMCHSGGRAPDLTRMSAATHKEFLDIVLQGTRSQRGMPGFHDALSPEQAQAIQAFVIHVTTTARAAASAAQPAHAPAPK